MEKKSTRRRQSKKIIFLVILTSIMVLILTQNGFATAQTNDWYSLSDTEQQYNYPITPEKNPEEWKKFETYQEMLVACQIPLNELSKMTTSSLIATCLNYPLYGNLIFQNSLDSGYRKMCSQFNGIAELYQRDDCARELLAFYKSIDLNQLMIYEPQAYLRYQWAEMMLSSEIVLTDLNYEERTDLLQAVYNNVKLINGKYSDNLSISSGLLVSSKILLIDSPDFANYIQNEPELASIIANGQISSCSNIITTEEDDWASFTQKYEEFVLDRLAN